MDSALAGRTALTGQKTNCDTTITPTAPNHTAPEKSPLRIQPESLRPSPDGTRVLALTERGRLMISSDGCENWQDFGKETAKRNPSAGVTGHTGSVMHVSWSPDGTRIATASYDNTARIWDVDGGKPLATMSGHTGTVMHVSWSPDGTRIATASSDATARIWDVDGGKPLATMS
ncbi:MAG TPA: hypothetical protein QGG18_08690, partial [Rhodospirillales bacterium]|nr:hypothetical protein [Rhodospirillales bacterium]